MLCFLFFISEIKGEKVNGNVSVGSDVSIVSVVATETIETSEFDALFKGFLG